MVRWTKHAKRQLRQIHDPIAQDSPVYAKRVVEALVQRTIGLNELPRKGKVVPELGEETLRELEQHPYRILYEIKAGNTIDILALIHTRRQIHGNETRRALTNQ